MVERQFNKPIKILRTDNGGEYTNKILQQFLLTHGITHQYSCPYTPEQNGLAERKHRHILEVTRALLLTANLPHYLWPDIMLTAVHLINILPSSAIHNNTPYFLLHNQPPSYNHLKTIGCLCFPWLRPYSANKLSPRSIPCVLLGYASHQKGYKCFDPLSHNIYISRHVRFSENHFPYKTNSTQQQSTTAHTTTPHPLTLIPHSLSTPPLHSSPTTSSNPHPTSENPLTTFRPNPPGPPSVTPPIPTIPEPSSSQSSHIPNPPKPPPHPMLTRSRTGHSKPKHILDLSHTISPSTTPTSFSQATKLPQWQQAMSAEMQALISQNT